MANFFFAFNIYKILYEEIVTIHLKQNEIRQFSGIKCFYYNMVMKVGYINPIMFKASAPVTKPDHNVNNNVQVKELSNVTPDFAVKMPQKYTSTGVKELSNGLKIHTYKLANGHKVTIVPMENSPTTVKNYVSVGSMNETDDIKGISHFLEHMAFNGTLGSQGYEKLEQGDTFKKVEKLGGWTNASTSYAITDYVNSTPLLKDSDLETQVRVIASMTEDLALTDEMIEKEKGPVCSEINMIMDSPETILLDQTVRTLFNIKSSADELVGGSVEHIKNLNREKVKNYYDTYYTPDNMNLVITGNVDPQKTIELVAKNFRSNKTRQGKAYEEKLNPIKSTVRKDFITDKATSTSVILGFAGQASNNTKDNIINEIVCEYLNSNDVGINKVLKKYNTGLEIGADKVSNNPNNPQVLYCGLTCSEENSEKALKVLFDKLSNIEKPSEETLNIIKERLLSDNKNRLEYSSAVNNMIGKCTLDNDIDYLTKYNDILAEITADDVKAYIDKYINLNKAAITVVHPKTTIESINKNHKEANNLSFKGAQRKPVNTSKVTETTISNNYKVLTHETTNDNFYINLSLNYNSINKKINPAALEILNEIYNMGTKDLDEDQYLDYLEKNNLGISVGLSPQYLDVIAQSSGKNIEKTITKLQEILTSPRILENEFNEAKSRLEDSLSRAKDTSTSLYLEHEANINPLYTSRSKVKEALKSVTLKDVQELHEYIMKNSSGAISINVPKNNPEVKDKILSQLESLPSVNSFDFKIKDVYKENSKPVVITKDRSVSQADIMQTYKYKHEHTPKECATESILNTLLSSSQSIGLFNTLREKEHLAYSVHSDLDRVGNAGELSCSILTTTDNKEIGEISYDNVQKSINGFHRQINKLLSSEYTDDDLEHAKNSLKAKLLKKEGVPSKLGAIMNGTFTDYGVDFENKMYEEIDSITREDIQKLAEKIFANPPIYSIVASKDTLEANKEYFKKLEQA